MKREKLTRADLGARSMGVLLLAAAVGLGLGTTGCDNTGGGVVTTPTGDATATSSSGMPPTMSELRVGVTMTDEQAGDLSPALETWREATRTELAEMDGPMSGGDGPLAIGGGADATPPVLEFLASGASVLDDDQFADLLGYLAGFRNAHSGADGGVKPPQGGPGPCGGLLQELDLSQEQLIEIRDARVEMQEAVAALRDEYENGTLSWEDFQAGVAEAHATFDARLAEILTEEQYQTLQELKAERAAAFAEQHLEHLDESVARRIELLTAILELSDEQAQAVSDILTGTIPEIEAVLVALRDGEITIEDAHLQLADIQKNAGDAIAALLTPEQLERFEALHELIPWHGPLADGPGGPGGIGYPGGPHGGHPGGRG